MPFLEKSLLDRGKEQSDGRSSRTVPRLLLVGLVVSQPVADSSLGFVGALRRRMVVEV